MNNRERFLNIMEAEKVDRLPCVHFGYWRELLDEWAAQGHISKEMARLTEDGNDYDKQLDKMLGWDFCYTSNWCANTGLAPCLDERVIKSDANGEYISDGVGVVHYKKKDCNGIPPEIDYLLKDRKAFEEIFKSRMMFDKNRLSLSQVEKLKKDWTMPKGLYVGSAFGEIRNMLTVIGMSYMICDDYDLLAEIVDTYSNMQYNCIKYVLEQGIRFDFFHYWEDICFKNGLLLSLTMFDDLCGKHYNRMSELAKQYSVKYISLDCDGDTTKLLPIWNKNGVNIMFPIEYGTWHGDYAKIRTSTDCEMRGVGGVNKEVFRIDKAAVDAEIERIKPLLELRRYLPCPDHRLVPWSKWELIQYYCDIIKRINL